ncbi:MAG: DJ/PfpI family protein [Brevibacillus sp.]|nr:DJ/PfpI family protein [Brevibacillus sp.]
MTNHLGMDLLGATGAIPVMARVVDDGNLVTGGGVTSGLDVALHLVERELGPRIAHAVEQLFEFERRGTVWRNIGNAPRNGAVFSDPNAAMDPARLQRTSVNGVIQGMATQGDEVSAFIDPDLKDDMLRWSQRITKPMCLNLKFEAMVDGDHMTGSVKASVLPASKLIGKRI